MLEIRFIRDNLELVKAGSERKRIKVDIDALVSIDDKRRELTAKLDTLRAERNRISRVVPTLEGEERERVIATMKDVADEIKRLGPELEATVSEFDRLMLEVPNPPADEVPDGMTEEDNAVVRHCGEVPSFDFELADHVALGERLGIIDIPRGVKLAGPRSYFLKGEGVRLESAVLQLGLAKAVEKGFTLMAPPHLVKDEAMIGTAWFPGGEEQAYRLEKDALNLIGTAEVSVTSYHQGEVLNESDLPLYYAGISACYRREAGTYGKDTKGLYRVHQFQKAELVVLCRDDPEESARQHEFITACAEELLRDLGLPYRVVLVCAGEMGRGQKKKYDIETWFPSRGGYSETHSSSKFHDYQARRLKIRYKGKDGKTRYVHTLNNTMVASPRILIPILELYQQPDGSVRVPEKLVPFMAGTTLLGPP